MGYLFEAQWVALAQTKRPTITVNTNPSGPMSENFGVIDFFRGILGVFIVGVFWVFILGPLGKPGTV